MESALTDSERPSMACNWMFRDCWTLLLLLLLGNLSEGQVSSLQIVFTKAPANITSDTTAILEFRLKDAQFQDPCNSTSCSILCKLDDSVAHECDSRGDSYVSLADGNHVFRVSVATPSGKFSTDYRWTVDTVPPTANVTANAAFTNALNVSVDIVFSEVCEGSGGFSCTDSSSCDLLVRGPGTVLPHTLNEVRPGLEYTVQVALSDASLTGRVFLVMAKDFCTDAAGNKFRRNDNSTFTVRFDREMVSVNVWTPIKGSRVSFNNQERTVEATNKREDLKIFLDFTDPVNNSTEVLRSSLQTNIGSLKAFRRKSRGNRRFAFLLTNISGSAVITVSLQTNMIFSRSGTVVGPVGPVSFIYDENRPRVRVSTTSPAKTRDRLVPVLIRFTEPVFRFESAGIMVTGGNISSFVEISKTTYVTQVTISGNSLASVFVPENKATDIAGNGNFPSNLLQIKRYDVPAVSVALYSFTSAGFLATTLASGALSLSCTGLAAAGALATRTVSAIATDPSRNLVRMTGHIQILVLSDWLTVSLPIEYRETVKGLTWLIPHVKVPWESHQRSTNEIPISSNSAASLKTANKNKNLQEQSGDIHTVIQKRKLESNGSIFGPPFSLNEYQQLFEGTMSELSLSELLHQKYTGWRDFQRNIFWLAAVGGGLVLLHVVVLQFFEWRTESPVKGALCFPRFELFLLMLSLPCLSQASSFVIKGGTTAGIIVGVLLLAIPATSLVSVFLFLTVAVIMGAFVEYREVRQVDAKRRLHGKILDAVIGNNVVGKWVRKQGLQSTFMPKYGLLFEDRKGPPRIMLVDAEGVPRWVDSGSNGIGKRRVVNSDDESERLPKRESIAGAARNFYILVDMLRRIGIGIVMGAYRTGNFGWEQAAIVLAFTVPQLLYLLIFKPFIRRGVHLVESLSLTCEAGVFAAAVVLGNLKNASDNNQVIGILMLSFLLLSFVGQLINEWYALMGLVLRLSSAQSQEPSLRVGLKMLGRGLLLPLIPKSKWSQFVTPQSQQPRIGLVPVVPLSPSPDSQRARVQPLASSPITVAETGIPYTPGSSDPSFLPATTSVMQQMQRGDKQVWKQWAKSWSSSSQSQGRKSNELKMLRELAKASFPGTKKDSDVVDESERGKKKMAAEAPEVVTSDSSSSNGTLSLTDLIRIQTPSAAALAASSIHHKVSEQPSTSEGNIAGSVLMGASSSRRTDDERY